LVRNPLAAEFEPNQTGDALDRFYTPWPLARFVASFVKSVCLKHELPVNSVIEPSVGGGALAMAARSRWPHASLQLVDLDPEAAGLKLPLHEPEGVTAYHQDWLTSKLRADLVLANPPFTGANALPHVWHAMACADTVALLLPLSLLGGVGRWKTTVQGREHRLIAVGAVHPRPWPLSLRESAVMIWTRHVTVHHKLDLGPELIATPRWTCVAPKVSKASADAARARRAGRRSAD
jgi:hypothetical protein